MKPIRNYVGRDLKWVQPKAMRREFELMDGEETIATLEFRSAFGSFATAETSDGSWTFKRIGFWKTRVTVCPAGSENEIASFRPNTWKGGGTLELPDGRSYRANTSFWATSYEFRDDSDMSLVRFSKFGGPFHLSSRVEIGPAAAALPELPWLVAFGWYLAIKMQDDAAGSAAAAAAG